MIIDPGTDVLFMQRALSLAEGAAAAGEVPVGAVLVRGDQVLAEAGNRPIASHDPTAHAEICALRTAAARAGNYRLPDTTLYVTLEPCTMCCGALVHARIGRLVFAAREPKAGAVVSTATVLDHPTLNHRVNWSEGLLAEVSARLLSDFFAARRR